MYRRALLTGLLMLVSTAASAHTGVGDTNVFGAPYAMRIWLNPDRLASYSLMPSDVVTAITNQNTEVAAGEIGEIGGRGAPIRRAAMLPRNRRRL